MPGLEGALAKFKKEQADATSRNITHSRPASATPARVPTPQPAIKRSHESAFLDLPSSSAIVPPQSAGHELLTNVNFARKYLKEKLPAALPFQEIIRHLSLPVDAEKNIPHIKQALEQDERVEVIRRGTSGNDNDLFKYRPKVPVTNAEELKDYLAGRDSASGILVSDLKDGWPDCVPAINKLEKESAVLVIRQKKENMPKLVFADSPSNHIHVDNDFRDFWFKTKLPTTEGEIRMELEKAGITPTSQVKEVKKVDNKKKERKKGRRQGGKITNTHLQGMLKDYGSR